MLSGIKSIEYKKLTIISTLICLLGKIYNIMTVWMIIHTVSLLPPILWDWQTFQ